MLGLGIGVNKRRLASGGAPPAYTPLDDSDLYAWWNAQAGTTTSGGELTAWLDRKANITANPPTVTSRPLYATDQINSLDVLTFRSADPNYIEIDVSSLGTGCIMYVVINVQNTAIWLMGNTAATTPRLLISDTPTTASDGFGTSIEYFKDTSSLGTNVTAQTLYAIFYNSTALLKFKNISFAGLNTLRFGTRSNLSSPLQGKVGDILITTSFDFETENDNFLIDKYGF